MANQVVWVDIPVVDLERAIRFYSAVLGRPLPTHGEGEAKMAFLPSESGDVGGCFVKGEPGPGATGPLIYLNCSGRLDDAVAAAEEAGGALLVPPQSIAPHGRRAVILDSEGNRVALHTR